MMQTQNNTKTCIEEETEKLGEKPLHRPPSGKSIYQRIKLKYMNNKRPSKPSLPHVLEPSMPLLLTGLMKPYLLQLSRITQFSPIAFANDWLLLILPSSTKTSLYIQIGYGEVRVEENHKEMCR